MRKDIIRLADEFLSSELMKSPHFEDCNVRSAEYRIEHSRRVANIGREIAICEKIDEEKTYIACLLHDIGYSIPYNNKEDFRNHGRYGAKIARPFLESLGFSEYDVNEMCYGIATHVDDKSDFEFEKTLISQTVGDADNIDRFDAFRLYEMLQANDYMNMPLEKQIEFVKSTIEKHKRILNIAFSSKTSQKMWEEKINFRIDFFKKLKSQAENSYPVIFD